MPLAWPLLHAGWPEVASSSSSSSPHPKRLLLWACNRFDYGAVGDELWYETVGNLSNRPAVTLVSSTAFEWRYAQLLRTSHFPSDAIVRPLGLLPGGTRDGNLGTRDGNLADCRDNLAEPNGMPACADRPSRFFVLPKINEARLSLADALSARGIEVWTPGIWPHSMQSWGGPRAVAAFRAAVHVPYAPTTFALYEHAVAGLLTFIPSASLLVSLYEKRNLFFQATQHDFVTTGHSAPDLATVLVATEWYAPENAPCFVYFDSLDDLDTKLHATDYGAHQDALRAWATEHINTTLARWRMLDRALLREDGR